MSILGSNDSKRQANKLIEEANFGFVFTCMKPFSGMGSTLVSRQTISADGTGHLSLDELLFLFRAVSLSVAKEIERTKDQTTFSLFCLALVADIRSMLDVEEEEAKS